MSEYTPIDCALHDRLESIATLGPSVQVEYVDDDGVLQSVHDRIVDVYAHGGAEYLRLAGGLEIRLDHLEMVDGIRYGASC